MLLGDDRGRGRRWARARSRTARRSSVFAASLPDARAHAGRARRRATRPTAPTDHRLARRSTVDPSTLLLLADPFSLPGRRLPRAACNDDLGPDLAVIGGAGVGGARPGRQPPRARRPRRARPARSACSSTGVDGAHGRVAGLPPDRSAVRRHARPSGNLIEELGGQPAIDAAAGARRRARREEDRELLRAGLHLGLVVDEHQAEFGRGDFLVRNVLGADRDAGRDRGRRRRRASARPCSSTSATRPPPTRTCASCSTGGRRRGRAAVHVQRARPAASSACPTTTPAWSTSCSGRSRSRARSARARSGRSAGSNFLHGFTASLALF